MPVNNWSWQYPTNYSNNTNGITGVSDFFFGYPNFLTSNLYSFGVIIALFVSFVALGTVLGWGLGAVIAVAGFITTILSIYLWLGGYISMWVPFVLMIITIIGALSSKSTREL